MSESETISQTPRRTFENFDKLELKKFCERLEKFVLVEQHFMEGSLVVSLNASFGSGKTCFLDMWANDLINRHKTEPKTPLPVRLNAWESDYCGDPLLAVVSAFTRAIETHGANRKQQETKARLRDAAKDLAWLTVSVGNAVVNKATGVNVVELAALAESKKESRSKRPDLLKAFEERTHALMQMKLALGECFDGKETQAIVLVDELDRCRPDFAIEYLETIKHVFDVKGLIFILAVDKRQLRSSAQAMFGGDLEFEEYYRKFVSRQIGLPELSKQGRHNLATAYAGRYIESTGDTGPVRITGSTANIEVIERAVEIAEALKLRPRQMDEVFRIAGHVLQAPENQRGKLYAGFTLGTVFLAALSVADSLLYSRMGKGELTNSQFCEFLKKLFGHQRDGDWWTTILVFGYQPSVEEPGWKIADEFVSLGFLTPDENPDQIRRHFAGFGEVWGHFSSSRLGTIYSAIEEVKLLIAQ